MFPEVSHDRGLANGRPRPPGVVIGPAPCLICEEDLRPLPLGAFLNGRKFFLHPYPPVSLITLQCLVHRPKLNSSWRGFRRRYLDSSSICLSVSSLFRPDAIFVDSAASPPSRYAFCQP